MFSCKDTTWDFRAKDGPLIAKNERRFVNRRTQTEERDICIDDSSLYEFTVYDAYGDGMDNRFGSGHYKILTHHSMSDEWSDGETILHGGYFMGKSITHLINTTIPAMDERDVKWLTSHNKRRRYWHETYNTTYTPLQWSESLKEEAQVWANKLLDACGTGAYHDPDRINGETNFAAMIELVLLLCLATAQDFLLRILRAPKAKMPRAMLVAVFGLLDESRTRS